jgi:hypothetical protein
MVCGINNNWPLADFEIHEIDEALENVQQFCGDWPEAKLIGMIAPSLNSTKNAIEPRSPQFFKTSFALLAKTCKNCHRETDHAFNVVTVPDLPPVVNQDFKPVQ